RRVAVSRNPVDTVASGSRSVTQSPSSWETASGLSRSRNTTCSRGGCFLSYDRANGTRSALASTASQLVAITLPRQARAELVTIRMSLICATRPGSGAKSAGGAWEQPKSVKAKTVTERRCRETSRNNVGKSRMAIPFGSAAGKQHVKPGADRQLAAWGLRLEP